MTKHAHGSSLVQTRHGHAHHRHSLDHKNEAAAAEPVAAAAESEEVLDVDHTHQHDHHVHSHARFHDELRKHHRQHHQHQPDQQQRQEELRRRQEQDLEAYVTRVVQTVSVIQYVDGTGSTLDVSTVYSPPRTQLVDPITGLTVDQSAAEVGGVLPTLAVSETEGGLVTLPTGTGTGTGTGTDSSSSVTEVPGSSPPLTSSPSTSSGFPSLPGVTNSSSPSPTGLSNSTLLPTFLNATTVSSTPFSSSLSSSSTTLSYLSSSSSSSVGPEVTFVGGVPTVDGDGSSGGATATPSPVSSSSGPSTPTSTLVGSVVGSICGVAILIFAAIFVIRWKKQHKNGVRLSGGDNDWGGSRALPAGGPSPPTPEPKGSRGFSNRMSERGLPFAIPATLAALSGGSGGKRALEEPSGSGAGTGERGFVRVSGKKLPSVLQHGGDGYSFPPTLHERNDSSLSGTSFYRDSHGNFFGGAGAGETGLNPAPAPRLALGSPMRPDSGLPVMHPSPARTPVTEHVSELAGGTPPSLTPPLPLLPLPDAVGRSLSSQDGSRASRGSGSRFTEDIR